jgi:hypothetical protein
MLSRARGGHWEAANGTVNLQGELGSGGRASIRALET